MLCENSQVTILIVFPQQYLLLYYTPFKSIVVPHLRDILYLEDMKLIFFELKYINGYKFFIIIWTFNGVVVEQCHL